MFLFHFQTFAGESWFGGVVWSGLDRMEYELGLVSQKMSLESFVAFHWSFVFFVWMCNALDLGFLLVLTRMRVSSGVSSRREFRV